MAYTRFLLDIGHGLHNNSRGQYDPGAVSGSNAEHTIVAGIAHSAEYALRDQFEIVILDEDSRSGLVEQVNGMSQRGDYLLSLHLNSAANAGANGSEVYYARNSSTKRKDEAWQVAEKIAAILKVINRGAFSEAVTPNGRLSPDGLVILTKTKPPALLIEFGFITNKKDLEAVKKRGTLALCETIRLLSRL
jgi:N-acetylmuramoyl-L-alanine amidase